jgi:hypothetical protein
MKSPKIALEVPKKNLLFGRKYVDYLYVLAHLMDDGLYRDEVHACKRLDMEIYLDNSAFELKESINIDVYIRLILEIEPTVVIVPDAIGDLPKTLQLTRRFYEGIPEKFLDRYKFMIVLQGRENRERMRCLHIIRSFGYPFHMVGLPRHACPNRVQLLNAVKRFTGKRPIHFLGLPDPQELKGLGGKIDSLDTSWVSKYSLGKGANDYLDFEHDEINEEKFIEGFNILINSF